VPERRRELHDAAFPLTGAYPPFINTCNNCK
jgi:hypothetical protein